MENHPQNRPFRIQLELSIGKLLWLFQALFCRNGNYASLGMARNYQEKWLAFRA